MEKYQKTCLKCRKKKSRKEFQYRAHCKWYEHPHRCKECLYEWFLFCTICNKFKSKSRFHKNHKYVCKKCRGGKKEADTSTYFSEHTLEMYAQRKERKKRDPMFKLSNNLRSRLVSALSRKSWNKNSKFSEYIGCSLVELKAHLERQWQHGMSWENYGLKGWHIDHIVPLISAKCEAELYLLCHYSNLRPLWWYQNLSRPRRGQSL